MATRTITYLSDEATEAAARDALAVQDGCNMLGIFNAFHRHMQAMKKSKVKSEYGEHEIDGDSRNGHPVCVLFISKLSDLSGLGNGDFERYSKSYDACLRFAGGEKEATLEVRKL